MSRYEHDHGDYSFAFGWDPPLRYFFLDVYKRGGDDDEPLFDNLRRKDPGMSIDEIKAVCRDYGWELPALYEMKLRRDRHEDLLAKGETPPRPIPGQS